MNEQMGMLPEPKKRRDDMVRVDFRLPKHVFEVLELWALHTGMSVSEVVRWMVIDHLHQRGRM